MTYISIRYIRLWPLKGEWISWFHPWQYALEVEKMGKQGFTQIWKRPNCDARRLSQRISKTAALVGWSMLTLVQKALNILMNPITWNTWHQDALWEKGENGANSVIHVNVSLTCTPYLSIVMDCVHSVIEKTNRTETLCCLNKPSDYFLNLSNHSFQVDTETC